MYQSLEFIIWFLFTNFYIGAGSGIGEQTSL